MSEQVENQSENHQNPDTGMDINTDDSVSGTTHLNEPVAEETEMEKLKAQVSELQDKFMRQAAEFDNYRKRTSRERIDMIQTAGREVITSMLEVLDDAERAEKQLETASSVNEMKEGVQLVFNKLRAKLQSKGLKPMESIKQYFDADLHEAITEIPAPNSDLKGKVVDEVEKGYYLNDKIIRHAKVVVGK